MTSLSATRSTLKYINKLMLHDSHDTVTSVKNFPGIMKCGTQFFMSIKGQFFCQTLEIPAFIRSIEEKHPCLTNRRDFKELKQFCDVQEDSSDQMRACAAKINDLSKRTLNQQTQAALDGETTRGFGMFMTGCRRGNLEALATFENQLESYSNRQSNGVSPLLAMCRFGHLGMIKQYLEKFSPEKQKELLCKSDEHGITPFLAASAKGHTKVIEYLAEHHAYVIDQKTLNGENALLLAAENGKCSTLARLLDFMGAAKMHERLSDGTHYLKYLCVIKRTDVISFLRYRTYGVLGNNVGTAQAFEFCLLSGRKQLASTLYFASRKQVTTRLFNGSNIYLHCLLREDFKAFLYLLKIERRTLISILLSQTGENGKTLLHEIFEKASPEIIKIVVQEIGKSTLPKWIGCLDRDNHPPAYYLYHRNLSIADIFENTSMELKRFAFENMNSSKHTLVHLCAKDNRFDLMTYIANECPDLLFRVDLYGFNFLQTVATKDNALDVLKWLRDLQFELPYGMQGRFSNLEMFKVYLLTSVHEGVQSTINLYPAFASYAIYGNQEAVQIALSIPRDPSLKQSLVLAEDKEKCNSFNYALSKGHLNIAQQLFDVCKEKLFDIEEGKPVEFSAAASGKVQVLDWLLEKKGPSMFNAENDMGQTLLLHFCDKGNLALVDWTCQKFKQHATEVGLESYLLRRDTFGRNALSLAAVSRNTSLTQKLLEVAPSIPFTGAQDAPNLMHEISSLEGTLPLFKLLYEKKPHVVRNQLKEKNEYGRTPFLNACHCGNLELAKAFYELQKDSLLAKDNNGKNAMHHACQFGSIEFVQWIYSIDPTLLFEKSTQKEPKYPFNLTSDPDIANWLLKEVTLTVDDPLKAEFFSLFHHYLDQETVEKTFFSDAFELLLPHKNLYYQPSQKLTEFLHDFNKHKVVPVVIKKQVSLKGDALVEFYNQKIPDIEYEHADQKILSAFYGISDEAYLASLNAGEDETFTLEEAKEKKLKDIEGTKVVLNKITNNAADAAVPKGKEPLYYEHLKRILKYLAKELETASVEDKLTYLDDLVFGNMCYTHYSTVLHNVYTRITEDSLFAEVSLSEDDPAKRFENGMLIALGDRIKKHTRKYLEHYNVHDAALYRRMLEESGIPHVLPDLIDQKEQEDAALTRMYSTQFGYETPAIYDTTYETVKKKTIENFFSAHVHSVETYLTLTKFIENGLSSQNPNQGPFLSELTEWLTKAEIQIDEILDFEVTQSGKVEYTLKHPQLVKVLSKFPMFESSV